MAVQEQIYKQHQHRKHPHEPAPLIELPTGPDDTTSEIQIHTTEILGKIARALGEITVQADS